jgi:sulfatase modifying factor 1
MPETLDEQRRAMLRRMRALGVVDDKQAGDVEGILFASKRIAQGNPESTRHPMTRAQCLEQRRAAGVRDEKKPLCGAPFMVPLYDPAKEQESSAQVCIDRFEFPGLPCEYPVTWVTTKQAQQLCNALGKRLCDAHEWEGGCAGALRPAEQEYAFGKPRSLMRSLHNANRELRWAYGPTKDHSKCATGSKRSKSCTASGWKPCGSNSYPAGAFPECRSPLGVYDQHGNVAEHMLLPATAAELGARGGVGDPEMKGSWFIVQSYVAHEDDCRWRAPDWHGNEGMNHSNYHLGFRCCKDVRPK